ncbi:MAG: SBBP repeat-containing protein, partial [Thermoguttaceae bacterium]
MLDKKILNGLWMLAMLHFVVLVFAVSSVQAEDPYGIVWSRQLGTNVGDYSYSVAVDANGSAFITGTTEGSLGGQNQGTTNVNDVFLAKYNSSGTLAWTRQLGTNSDDYGSAVA